MSIATGKGVPGLALSCPPVMRILFCLLCNTSPASFMHFCTSFFFRKEAKQAIIRCRRFTRARQLVSKWMSCCWTTCFVMFVVLSFQTFCCPTSVLLWLPSDVKRTTINRILAVIATSVQKLHQFCCSLSRTSGVHTNIVTPSVSTW